MKQEMNPTYLRASRSPLAPTHAYRRTADGVGCFPFDASTLRNQSATAKTPHASPFHPLLSNPNQQPTDHYTDRHCCTSKPTPTPPTNTTPAAADAGAATTRRGERGGRNDAPHENEDGVAEDEEVPEVDRGAQHVHLHTHTHTRTHTRFRVAVSLGSAHTHTIPAPSASDPTRWNHARSP
eukprot:1417728-Rhodomonas_salina.2